ncbi:MAG: mechanosensitive ion channel family protein [Bacteroidia bacterium]
MEEVLNQPIIHFGSYKYSVYHLITVAGIFVLTWAILRIIKMGIRKSKKLDAGSKHSIFQIIKYFIIVVAAASTLQFLGFNVTVLIASSAALLVGLGLGMQHLFNDYISGIIMLVDGTLKVDDVIEVNNVVGKVVQINLRTTKVITRDDKFIILPNSSLTNNNLINWTHSEIKSRFDVAIGVAYGSDADQVIGILREVANTHHLIYKDPKPIIRLANFGDSSVDFLVLFWTDDVFRVEQIKSELRLAIYKALAENNVTIPFPQRTLHLSQEALDTLKNKSQ